MREKTAAMRACSTGALVGLTVAVLVLSGAPAQAADSVSLGRRYDDGLDTRLSALRLRDASAALGYASGASTVGRSAGDAWGDGLNSAVFGLFGHANGGLFQLDEAPAGETEPWLIAGRSTDVLPPSSDTRAFTEYLPFLDVDDMRLLVLAGCYTADPGVNGDFIAVAESRGIDSVIAFQDLIRYPSTAPGTAISTTDYGGNYFWTRFSAHVTNGADLRTALARARTDLVTKEGAANGWDLYVIAGAVADPGAVRLSPAGNGQLFDSDPVPTTAFSSLAALTVTGTRSGTSAGLAVTEVDTMEGVRYRLLSNGSVLDAVGTASRIGDAMLTDEQARAVAEDFLATHTGAGPAEWSLEESRPAGHGDGEVLTAFHWAARSTGAQGPGRVDVEVDRRTGAVVYYSATRPSTQPDLSPPRISRAEAVSAVADLVETDGARLTAVPEVWDRAYWLVTVDRGLSDGVPDLDQLRVDALTGRVSAHLTT